MATFNSFSVVPTVISFTSSAPVWAAAADLGLVFGLSTTSIAPVWPPESEPVAISSTLFTTVFPSVGERIEYADGFYDGELYGFSNQREEIMEPIQIGETDDDLKTISFMLYDSYGFPASGNAGEGAVASPSVGDVQINRDLTGYVNATGTFAHISDGEYRYTFANSEVASGGGEGNVWFRAKIAGFRTVTLRVPVRDVITNTGARDAVLNAARSGFIGTGTIGEGVSIASSLLQGNYYMDNVTNGGNGQTAARIRCFHTGAATAAATNGGSGEGEFATFLVTTTYEGPNKIASHRVVQQ